MSISKNLGNILVNQISNTNSVGNISLTNITTSNIISTTASIDSIISTNNTLTNLILTSGSIGSLSTGNISVSGNITVGGNLLVQGTLISVNVTSVNVINSNITTSSLNSANITSTNIVGTNISAGSLNLTTLNISTITTGSLLASTQISSGNIYSTNVTSINIVGTNISAGSLNLTTLNISTITTTSLLATNVYSTNITSTNVTSTNIVATNITTSTFKTTNISAVSVLINNGSLQSLQIGNNASGSNLLFYGPYTDGYAYIQSGSSTTSGSLKLSSWNGSELANLMFISNNTIFTGGNIGINTSNPIFSLDVSGTSRITTSLTTANVYSTNITSTNIVGTTSTIPNIIHTNITTSSILATTQVSSGALYSTNITSTNIVATTSTIPNIIHTNITTSSILATTQVSSGALYSTNITSTNIVGTTSTIPNIIHTNITTSSILATTQVSSGAVYSTNITSTNIVGTTSTIPNIIHTNISTSTLISTNSSLGTINSTGLTTGNINFTGNLYQNGVNYIGSQWLGTNGTLLTYGSAGSGALVGINTTNPSFTLDVNGTSRITTLTTSNITSTNLVSTNSSLGTINSIGITTGNINFTGNLYQNGTSYVGSQWTTTTSNLSYTSGDIIVSNNISSSGLITINASIGSLSIGNISLSGNITVGGNLIVQGTLISVNVTAVNVINNNITTGTFLSNIATINNSTITSLNVTNLTVGSITNTNSFNSYITISNLRLTDNAFLDIDTGPSGNSRLALVKKAGGGPFIASNNATALTFAAANTTDAANVGGSYTTTMTLTSQGNLNVSSVSTGNIISTNISTNNITINTALNLYSGFNETFNRQLWIGDSTLPTNNTTGAFRIGILGNNTYIGVISNDGTTILPLSLQGNLDISNNISISGSQMSLNNGASNTIVYNNAGVAPPSGAANMGGGCKLALWSGYGIGIDSDTQWYASAGGIHNWYHGTTSKMSLNAGNLYLEAGNLFVNGNVSTAIVTMGNFYTSNPLNYIAGTSIGNAALNIRDTGNKLIAFIYGTNTVGNINSLGPNPGLSIDGGGNIGQIFAASTGNVGINTIDPTFTLDVNGTTRITTSLTTGAVYSTNITSTNLVSNVATISNLVYSTLTIGNMLSNNLNLGTTSMFSGSFSASNNQSSATNVTGLIFDYNNISYFEIILTVNITTSTPSTLNAVYTIRGNYSSGWAIADSYIGDTTGITFSINSSTGQILYTSTNISLWTSDIFRYRVEQITSTGTYTSLIAGATTSNYSFNTLQILSTTDALPNNNIGALQIAGGVTIAKELFVGGSSFFNTIGSLGINNTNPAYNLDVNGNANFTTFITTGNVYSTNLTSTNIVTTNISSSTLNLNSLFMDTGTNGNLFTSTFNTRNWSITNPTTSSTSLPVVFNTNNTWDFQTDAASRIYIADANIGINNTSPSYSLDISGSSRITTRLDIGGTQPSFSSGTIGRLFITGPSSASNGGPHFLMNTTQDQYPTVHWLNFTHDNLALNLDCYYDGSFRTSGTNTAFQMYKQTNQLRFTFATGSAGSTKSFTNALVIGSTGNVSISGALSKGSGTFDIQHPILPTKRLVHSFIEGPRCDLIYRGSVQLSQGNALVNIDSDCTFNTIGNMTQGTFEALTINPVCYLQNNISFDRVRGTINTNILQIICENNYSNDIIDWMVIAERNDQFIKQWERTDSQGFLVTEYIPNTPTNDTM